LAEPLTRTFTTTVIEAPCVSDAVVQVTVPRLAVRCTSRLTGRLADAEERRGGGPVIADGHALSSIGAFVVAVIVKLIDCEGLMVVARSTDYVAVVVKV
jgi:hypothetical protein